jgi:phosphoribosyl-ATP pyrophosphohydrolase
MREDSRHHIEDLVQIFNKQVLNVDANDRPIALMPAPEFELSLKQLKEEIEELCLARDLGCTVRSVDALIDLMYFTVGVLIKHGLDATKINTCLTLVHQANMEKKAGVIKSRAVKGAVDAVKPADWVAPDLRIAKYLGIELISVDEG